MFFTIFYQPIFNLLVFLYNTAAWHDLGVAIILLTILIRLILWPLNKRAIKSQKALQTLQPDIEALKEKYKDERDKLAQATMALYKEKKINPFGSCLPILVQLPFLFAIYRVFFNELKDGAVFDPNVLYPFVGNPGSLNALAFGFLDLSERSIVLAVLAGASQFWQSKMMMAKSGGQGAANALAKQMTYFMPIVTVVIGASFPAGLTLYWLMTTLFSVFQQYITFGFKKKTTVEVVERK